MSCDCHVEVKDASQKKVLLTLLLINAVLFVSEIVVGIIAQSSGVIADAIDMFADALVYAIALFAVGKVPEKKNAAARLAGYFQVGIATLVLIDIVRRFVVGSAPESIAMFVISCFALIANIFCLYLISKQRNEDVHMRASWIFAKSDVLANFGVIVASILIHFTGSRWPDLVVGIAITIVVFRAGIQILKEATEDKRLRLLSP